MQDAKPIRNILKQIKDQLSRELKAKILKVAFIENRKLQIQEAQDRLEERIRQERLTQDREILNNN